MISLCKHEIGFWKIRGNFISMDENVSNLKVTLLNMHFSIYYYSILYKKFESLYITHQDNLLWKLAVCFYILTGRGTRSMQIWRQKKESTKLFKNPI